MGFQNAVDICNRAAQHCGVQRIKDFNEDSRQAAEFASCYDKLRQAELRRNYWQFATKKAALRPLDNTTRTLLPVLWARTTTYTWGSLVTDEAGAIWQSRAYDNTNNQPGNTAQWELYFGPLTAQPFDRTVSYYAGELVYTTPGDGTYKVYMSLVTGNEADPTSATAWDAATQYGQDQVVLYSGTYYASLADFNTGNNPATSPALWQATADFGKANSAWIEIGVALTQEQIIYPLGAGPAWQATTRNVFRLPANFLRRAPQDPKAGSASFLGAPTGLRYDDWLLEGKYIVSREVYPIVLRFIADVTDVSAFDPMFCEGLAARIALETVEVLTQSTQKLAAIAQAYRQFMTEARTVNGIETGAEEPPEDDWITTRI